METFEDLYNARSDLRIHKWLNYFHVYEAHMGRFRGQSVKLLEIGVQRGGSAQLFREYLGPRALVVGVDIDPACAAHADGHSLQIEIGDQADPDFLGYIKQKHGPFDIVLDDGGHKASQILTSFEYLFSAINLGGVYLIEDTCCQYWSGSVFIDRGDTAWNDFVIDLNNRLNADMGKQQLFEHWHIPVEKRKEKLHTQGEDRFIHSIHLYESIVAIEKNQRRLPYSELRD